MKRSEVFLKAAKRMHSHRMDQGYGMCAAVENIAGSLSTADTSMIYRFCPTKRQAEAPIYWGALFGQDDDDMRDIRDPRLYTQLRLTPTRAQLRRARDHRVLALLFMYQIAMDDEDE